MEKSKQRIIRINGRFYDTQTPNKSFLQVARDLKERGIKNWYFMLEVRDPYVVGINPYQCDENGNCTLSKDAISRLMTEISRNMWFYLREVCRIPEAGASGGGVQYRANRGNIAQAWCFYHGIDSWLCLPRQQGKTVSCLSMLGWVYSFGTTNSQFIFINKDGENAKENLRRIKTQIDILPQYLRFEQALDDDGKITKAVKNATRMQHPVTHNSIIVKSKATSKDSALSLARGLTAPILHFDEPEFTNKIKIIIENSVSTYQTAAENAKKNGAMYGRIFTCTPGDLDTEPGKDAQIILDATKKWDEKLYDMNPDDARNYATARGNNGILYIEYQYWQIGKTREWFNNIADKIHDDLTTRREVLLQRLHGSSLSPYDREDIEYIISTQQVPVEELSFTLLDYYRFDVYTELDRKQPYLVGIDCSTGTVGDNNTITIIDPYTIMPVAEFECSYIGETLYEKLIIELVRKVLPRAIIIIERNSVGDGIIDHLLNSTIRNNLYFDKDKDLVSKNMSEHETVESVLKQKAKEKTFYGVYTSGASREDMFTILSRHVAEYKDKFVTKNIIRDICRLIKTSSGRIEAAPGFHDDSIMSYLIAMYVFYHGNNLPMFGFVKGSQEIKDQNTGMTRPEDLNSSLLDDDTKHIIQTQLEKEQNQPDDFQRMMREAILQSQSESMKLVKAGLVHNTVIENTPDYMIDEYDSSGTVDLSFFDEINGF